MRRILIIFIISIAALLALPALGGRLDSAALAANGSVVYTYDALGRISSISYDTGAFVFYTYDANGNRTAQTINVNNAGGNWGSITWGAALWQ